MTTTPDRRSAPLFDTSPEGFVWATGIEDTFVAQTERLGERVLDEYALTHHYLYWREDLDRAADLGVRAIRYGVPWYRVEPEPGRFEWEWVDRALEHAAGRGLAVIADLMHYGTPLWLDNQFLNSSYPERVAYYSGEFAARYRGLLSHYTPLNEPLITMDFCGERGIWPPYLRGDDGSVKVLRSIAKGIVLTVETVRQADPGAVIVSVDAAGEFFPETPAQEAEARFRNERTFAATDLLLGRVDESHPLRPWMLRHGITEEDLRWFRDHAVDVDVVGVNYYPEFSVHTVKDPESREPGGLVWAGVEGLERAVRAFAERYGKPVAITETSTNGTLEQRARWLRDSTSCVPSLRAAGVPLVGYTWWPLFDMIDWSYRAGARPIEDFIARMGPPALDMQQVSNMVNALKWQSLEHMPLEAYLAPMGLYELEMSFDGTFHRVHTPLVDAYRDAVRTWHEAASAEQTV